MKFEFDPAKSTSTTAEPRHASSAQEFPATKKKPSMKAIKTSPKFRRQIKPITGAEFDAKFDAGEDISEYLDLENVRVFAPDEDDALDLAPQKVNVDFPSWVVSALDREANRIGIARQALIKTWIVERLELVTAK